MVLEGYINIAGYCRPNLGMGGVGLWGKSNLNVHALEVSDFCVEGECELAAATVDLGGDHKVLIVVGYRPPTKHYDIFFEMLTSCLSHITKKNHTTVVLGDFNIDLSVMSFESQELIALMASFGLHNSVNSYTRECLMSRTLIDHVFSDDSDILTEVIVSGLSDHHAQSATLLYSSTKKPRRAKYRYCRTFSDENKQYFRYLLKKEHWHGMYAETCFNQQFDAFYEQLKYHFEVAFPVTLKKIKNKNPNIIKFNREILNLKSEVIEWYSKTKDLPSTHFLRQFYLTLKQKYKFLIRQWKSKAISDRIESSDNKAKTLWTIINENKSNSKKDHGVGLCIENEIGGFVNDPGEIAKIFNDYFISVGLKKAERTTETECAPLLSNADKSESFFLFPTSDKEVLSIIKNLKRKKSAGADEMSAMLIKEVSDLLSKPLSYLINASFLIGSFPEALKLSVVRPIFKKGNKLKCDNYRPISILSTLSKIFERVMLSRFCSYLSRNNILSEHQYGFTKSKSTTNAIFSLVNNVVKALDKSECAVALFLT